MIRTSQTASRREFGFSMVEMLMTIGIMSIISSLVIISVTNASRDASRVMARQQQAAVQSAINAWVVGNGRYPDTYSDASLRGKIRSQETLRSTYNSYTTSLAKFNQIASFLDEGTASHIISNTTNSGKLKSEALLMTKQYLELPEWASGSYPKVNLVTE